MMLLQINLFFRERCKNVVRSVCERERERDRETELKKVRERCE